MESNIKLFFITQPIRLNFRGQLGGEKTQIVLILSEYYYMHTDFQPDFPVADKDFFGKCLAYSISFADAYLSTYFPDLCSLSPKCTLTVAAPDSQTQPIFSFKVRVRDTLS